MADFCKQCSIEMFGEDGEDLKGISDRTLTKEEKEKGLGWSAICEGCGFIIVNDEGECITENCLKRHGCEHIS